MATKARPPNKLLTLLFVLRGEEVLLGMKKRGFGQGRWNGFGGKVQENESIEEAAIRETNEECCLTVSQLDKVGVILFEFVGEPQIMEVHVYRTHTFTGQPTETEEMNPQWFTHKDVPYQCMWPDDKLWYPKMLNGGYFDARMTFQGYDIVLDYTITDRPTQT